MGSKSGFRYMYAEAGSTPASRERQRLKRLGMLPTYLAGLPHQVSIGLPLVSRIIIFRDISGSIMVLLLACQQPASPTEPTWL